MTCLTSDDSRDNKENKPKRNREGDDTDPRQESKDCYYSYIMLTAEVLGEMNEESVMSEEDP